MARSSKKNLRNPLDDISKAATGWLGDAAKGLSMLIGPDSPTVNPQTKKAVDATRVVGDVVTGGAVTAMRGGPDAVERYAAQQAALYAAGLAAGPAINATVMGAKIVKNPVLRAQAARRAVDAAQTTKQALREAVPVSQKTVKAIQLQHAEDMLRLSQRADAKYMDQVRKNAGMANNAIKKYHETSPVYWRAEAMHIEDVSRQLRAANAPAMEINIDPKAVSRNLNKAANEIFRETMEQGMRDPANQYPGWQQDVLDQLKKDIDEIQVYQRARGMLHRAGIENTRRLPLDNVEKRLAAEFRREDLQDRLETQYLRSMMRRSNPRKLR